MDLSCLSAHDKGSHRYFWLDIIVNIITTVNLKLTARFVLFKPVECRWPCLRLLGDVLCKSVDLTDEVLCVVSREHLKQQLVSVIKRELTRLTYWHTWTWCYVLLIMLLCITTTVSVELQLGWGVVIYYVLLERLTEYSPLACHRHIDSIRTWGLGRVKIKLEGVV